MRFTFEEFSAYSRIFHLPGSVLQRFKIEALAGSHVACLNVKEVTRNQTDQRISFWSCPTIVHYPLTVTQLVLIDENGVGVQRSGFGWGNSVNVTAGQILEVRFDVHTPYHCKVAYAKAADLLQ